MRVTSHVVLHRCRIALADLCPVQHGTEGGAARSGLDDDTPSSPRMMDALRAVARLSPLAVASIEGTRG